MSSLITNATIQIRQDTAGNWTSTNPTPAAGEWCKEIDTGALKQGDGSTAWNDLEYRQQLPFTNDLTSGNITHTLPVITGFPQTEAIYWENGGTYKLTLAVTDSETVGGLSAGTWEGEGEGHMIVESDGTNWQVREYEDSGDVSEGTYYKNKSGKMTVKSDLLTLVYSSVNFLLKTWTYGVIFIDVPSISTLLLDSRTGGGTFAVNESNGWRLGLLSRTHTSSDSLLRLVSEGLFTGGDTYKSYFDVTGRWRT